MKISAGDIITFSGSGELYKVLDPFYRSYNPLIESDLLSVVILTGKYIGINVAFPYGSEILINDLTDFEKIYWGSK